MDIPFRTKAQATHAVLLTGVKPRIDDTEIFRTGAL
jgi:hypothetical protein